MVSQIDTQELKMDDEDNNVKEIFSFTARLQRYLDVEAALALTQADLDIIPHSAAKDIMKAADIDLLDVNKIKKDQEITGHFMMPLVSELSRVVGKRGGGYVHWGATTQNIEQTGDVLGIHSAIKILSDQLCNVIEALAILGEKTSETVMAGRTHWQQAVPITFGFKVATWNDVLIRHYERLEQIKPRLLTSMTGGAVGNFASFGSLGPAIQEGVAQRLNLTPMPVPARNIVDHFAEYVLLLGMISSTLTSIAEEISRLMATEFNEVSECLPTEDIGSSTMPQKRNAKKCGEVVIKSAQIRSFVPSALESMIQSHEVDGTRSAIMQNAIEQSSILSSDILKAIYSVITDLEIYPDRMKKNLDLSGGLINAEAVMMALARKSGRQIAHEIIHETANQVVKSDGKVTFFDILSKDSRIKEHLSPMEIQKLLDPATHIGLSAKLAQETSSRAYVLVNRNRK